MNLLLIGSLGFCAGLRTMTPIAVLCWFAYRNALHFQGWRSFTASLVSVVIFTLMALGEYVGDKLPSTPSRTAPLGLVSRAAFGGFAGLLLAQPLQQKVVLAVVLGIVGAILGTYAGWWVRTRTMVALQSPDWPVAVAEDIVTIALSIVLLNSVVTHSAMFAGNAGAFLR